MSRHVRPGIVSGLASVFAAAGSLSAQTVGPIWTCAGDRSEVCGGGRCVVEPAPDVRLEFNTQRRRMKLWHPVPVLMEGPYRGHLETGAQAVVVLTGYLMQLTPPEPERQAISVEINRETRQFTFGAFGRQTTGRCEFDPHMR